MIKDKITSKYIVHIIGTMDLESDVKSHGNTQETRDPDMEEIMNHLMEFAPKTYKEKKIELLGKSWVCFDFVFLVFIFVYMIFCFELIRKK